MKRVRTFIAKGKGHTVELTIKINKSKDFWYDDLHREVENEFDKYYRLLLETFNQKEIRVKCR